ncbi:hypothetical protein [Marinobacter xiaoshiensis]|uniref:Uncharacterized protein n=1 Tax=Marinobacter xiaoshiensis TaxID=3073652 RepID=A0ABU2HLW8_9GAMM|nr:hypothetical protein [Marinobacter sp. F60267]MDS1311566.1 hypothetical protein [Marinobacter sp. F60267]
MSNEQAVPAYTHMAFRASAIHPLPASSTKRTRIGEELQPVGTYVGAIPYHGTIQDVEALQDHEKTDPEFTDKDWWWDHHKIRFLNGKLGLKFLLLIIPLTWVLFLWFSGIGVICWGTIKILDQPGISDFSAIVVMVVGFILTLSWFAFAIWITPVTTNWLMSTGLGFFLKPFEKNIHKKLDDTLEDGCSEFNRLTGQVRIALGRKRFFDAPFVEFDAYVERVVQQGGIFYRLMLVHRYTQKTFNKTAFSTIEAEKHEVLALWDMLQRYMDVTQPLPDTPRLEPFRHLDPVTAEHDKQTGRNPRYWRDLDLDSWKDGEGWRELYQRQRQYPWGSRACKLTPQLGRISMEEYRQKRPAGSWPI